MTTLWDGPARASHVLLLAHGAGAPMDSPFMNTVARGLGEAGIGVARFEFPYMAKRRVDGKKRGPDTMPRLLDAFREAAAAQARRTRLFIGGKSMGGRVASMLADELRVKGLVCFGYPFHPPGNAAKLRTEHLVSLKTAALVLQGSRDPFGTRDEVVGYTLSRKLRVHWLEDGDHDLSPRKRSGRTHDQNLAEAVKATVAFLKTERRGRSASFSS